MYRGLTGGRRATETVMRGLLCSTLLGDQLFVTTTYLPFLVLQRSLLSRGGLQKGLTTRRFCTAQCAVTLQEYRTKDIIYVAANHHTNWYAMVSGIQIRWNIDTVHKIRRMKRKGLSLQFCYSPRSECQFIAWHDRLTPFSS